jgi:hypothetical protein
MNLQLLFEISLLMVVLVTALQNKHVYRICMGTVSWNG